MRVEKTFDIVDYQLGITLLPIVENGFIADMEMPDSIITGYVPPIKESREDVAIRLPLDQWLKNKTFQCQHTIIVRNLCW